MIQLSPNHVSPVTLGRLGPTGRNDAPTMGRDQVPTPGPEGQRLITWSGMLPANAA